MKDKKRIKRWLWLIGILIALYFFITCLPDPLFSTPYSTVLEDRKGELLGALIASDEQWRFPKNDTVPEKFRKAIVRFEDKRFYHHPGVDVLAIARAIRKNISEQKIKSGGSTLTMQVIRLARKNKKRNLWQKMAEAVMAVRLECGYSKDEILALYASQAPFGNNVVGLDAAAWRYFGKGAAHLSWGEAATLAVLPNSPALVRLDRNRDALLKKRNRLLEALLLSGEMDSITCTLAMAEPLPGKPLPLPRLAPHLLARVRKENRKRDDAQETTTRSTLSRELQVQVNAIVRRHHEVLRGNGINNAAVLVAEVETGNVLAYLGNVFNPEQPEFDSEVDVVMAPRSTGSILKPFLYAAQLSEGELLPNTLMPDIPTQIAGYSPQNFNREYDGAVPASRVLERSLNVPAVRMLRGYGYEKFHRLLQKAGMSTLTRSPHHYGLSLILGGAEGKLWDIAGMYASMARTLNHFRKHNGRYDERDLHPLSYQHATVDEKEKELSELKEGGLLSAASIWCTFNAMEEVNRPDREMNWKSFGSSRRIAWKTGTSFGFRDGWAVGCTPGYVVAVWVGNADGEGRPGLIGVSTAAPILFDIFKLLPTSGWFEQPYDDMERVPVCSQSGHRALELCGMQDSAWVPVAGLRTSPCPYHQLVHLDASGKWRVGSECESTATMQHKPWFVLPPAQEWFYKTKNRGYQPLPPWRSDCAQHNPSAVMEFIYPKKSSQIYVPVELDGKTGKAVFEVAHRSADAVIYWHLDDEFLGETKNFHQMPLNPDPGKHIITLVDSKGERVEQYFEVLKRE